MTTAALSPPVAMDIGRGVPYGAVVAVPLWEKVF